MKKKSPLKKSGKTKSSPVSNKKVGKNKKQTPAPQEETNPSISELSAETMSTETATASETPEKTVELSKAFILVGNMLCKRTALQIGMDGENPPIEKQFKSAKELEELVLINGKTLFGEHSVIIDARGKVREYEVFPDKFLFDLKNLEKPKFYIVETMLSRQTLAHLLERITQFFSLFKNDTTHFNFLEKICRLVETDEKTKNELESKITGKYENTGYLAAQALKQKLAILLVMDTYQSDLPTLMEVYSNTWGKYVKPILIRKFKAEDGSFLYTMTPDFAGIWKDTGKKRERDNTVYTEEYHFEELPETIKNIYEKCKTELLKKDDTLEFRPKKFYISMRKGRNLAFFHLRKKSISLVIMCPEKDTRKQIKHHEIKSLPASVQKFWNGECCTIMIENSEHLNEVINLLKKLIANS